MLQYIFLSSQVHWSNYLALRTTASIIVSVLYFLPWAFSSTYLWSKSGENNFAKIGLNYNLASFVKDGQGNAAIVATILSSILATLSRFGELVGSQELGRLSPTVSGLINGFMHTMSLPIVALLSWLFYNQDFGSTFEFVGVVLILFGLCFILLAQWLRWRQMTVEDDQQNLENNMDVGEDVPMLKSK